MTDQNQILEGFFKPKSKYVKGGKPPVFSKITEFGRQHEDSFYFANVKIRLMAASIDFPSPSLFLQVANGKGSVYQRCTPEQLAYLGEWITSVAEECNDYWENEQKNAHHIEAMRGAQEQLIATMQPEGENNEFIEALNLMKQSGNIEGMRELMDNLIGSFAELTGQKLQDTSIFDEGPTPEQAIEDPEKAKKPSKKKKEVETTD